MSYSALCIYDQIPVIHYKTMETETIYYPLTRSECEVAVHYKKVVDFKWTKLMEKGCLRRSSYGILISAVKRLIMINRI